MDDNDNDDDNDRITKKKKKTRFPKKIRKEGKYNDDDDDIFIATCFSCIHAIWILSFKCEKCHQINIQLCATTPLL